MTGSNSYNQLSDNALRQYIDACAVYEELHRVSMEACHYRGGMYWKRHGSYEYLVRTASDNRRTRLGKRFAETERVYQCFKKRKDEIEIRLRCLRTTLREAERVNKALRVGHVPACLVEFMSRLRHACVSDQFIVVGTGALYAYEARAAVRISDKAFPGGCRRASHRHQRIHVLMDERASDEAIRRTLQRADPSFRWKKRKLLLATNGHGLEVQCLRCAPPDSGGVRLPESHDFQMWPGQHFRLRAPPQLLEQIVVA
jgi:hypothetical protein